MRPVVQGREAVTDRPAPDAPDATPAAVYQSTLAFLRALRELLVGLDACIGALTEMAAEQRRAPAPTPAAFLSHDPDEMDDDARSEACA